MAKEGEEEKQETEIPESYLDSLDAAREDAKFSFNEHMRAFEDEAAKGWRIAQLDGIILTIFISFLATSGLNTIFVNTVTLGMVIAGTVSLILGVLGGLYCQLGIDVAVGISEIGLDGILRTKSDEQAYKEWSIEHYKKWITQANEKASERNFVVKFTGILSGLGIALISAGTLFAFLG